MKDFPEQAASLPVMLRANITYQILYKNLLYLTDSVTCQYELDLFVFIVYTQTHTHNNTNACT